KLQRAAGNAELVQRPELFPGLAAVVAPGDDAGVAVQQSRDLFRCLAYEIDAEPGDAELAHPPDALRAALGHGAVAGTPTPRIDVDRKQRAGTILQLHLVSVARSPAVAVILPRAEERREHTVLHVEHGHVHVNGRLVALRPRAPYHRRELLPVQIVTR